MSIRLIYLKCGWYKMKKLSAKQKLLKAEYQKARNAAKARVKRLETKGIIFEKNPIPPIPKRVTEKSIERLKKIQRPELIKKSSIVDEATGELKAATIKFDIKGQEKPKEYPTEVSYIKQKRAKEPKKKKEPKEPKKKKEPKEPKETKEPKEPKEESEYIPTISIYDTIVSAIENLPSYIVMKKKGSHGTYYSVEDDKQKMVDIMNDVISESISESDEQAYYKHLEEHQAELFDEFDMFRHAAYEDEIQGSISRIFTILSSKPLDAKTAKKLAEYAENLEALENPT